MRLDVDREISAWAMEDTLLARGDALWGNVELFINGRAKKSEGTLDGRLSYEKIDHDGRLLGPLRATTIRTGHGNTRALPLVSRAAPALGVELSNAELIARREFHNVTVSGTHMPGWSVELYHNGTLLAFSSVDDTGRYRSGASCVLLRNATDGSPRAEACGRSTLPFLHRFLVEGVSVDTARVSDRHEAGRWHTLPGDLFERKIDYELLAGGSEIASPGQCLPSGCSPL